MKNEIDYNSFDHTSSQASYLPPGCAEGSSLPPWGEAIPVPFEGQIHLLHPPVRDHPPRWGALFVLSLKWLIGVRLRGVVRPDMCVARGSQYSYL